VLSHPLQHWLQSHQGQLLHLLLLLSRLLCLLLSRLLQQLLLLLVIVHLLFLLLLVVSVLLLVVMVHISRAQRSITWAPWLVVHGTAWKPSN
jgi:hypothetical protein